MELYKLECPNCGAKELALDENGYLVCRFWRQQLWRDHARLPKAVVPITKSRCGFASGVATVDPGLPVCGADNWILAEHCVQCGRSLDLIEQMARRWQLTTQHRLQEWKGEIAQVKAAEEKASEGRMATLMEAERIRQEALALARATQRKRDRQIYTWLVIIVVVFVLLIVLFMILSWIGR